MQFRAGVLYVALFVVIAAGSYGVIATAESPHVTADGVAVDYTLEEAQEFEVDGQTFNVTQLGDGSGTVEYVNESAILEVQWEDEGTVLVDEDTEYTVAINQPGDQNETADDGEAENDTAEGENASDGTAEGDGDDSDDNETADGDGDEAENASDGTADGDGDENGDGSDDNESDDADDPESFSLRENFDEDEYDTLEDEDGETYIVTGDGEHVHIDDFDGINSTTYEVGDTVEFYDEEGEELVEGEVTDIGSDMVTVEYVGTEITEHDLEHGETVTLNDQEFAVYFSGGQAQLSSDVGALEAQQEEVEDFDDRIRGLWWSIRLSVLAAVLIAGLAFMPVRG